jgi:hypothetical protein
MRSVGLDLGARPTSRSVRWCKAPSCSEGAFEGSVSLRVSPAQLRSEGSTNVAVELPSRAACGKLQRAEGTDNA